MRRYFNLYTAVLLSSVAAWGIAPAASAQAQGEVRFEFDSEAQSLQSAVEAIGRITGESIVAPAKLIADLVSPPLRGRYSAAEALARILEGSGLRARRIGAGYIIERAASEPLAGTPEADGAIVVTGTRIRGAVPAGANVITITRSDIEKSGYATTQQLLQSLPQNFGGGPNEGTVGFSVRNNANTNFGFGSSINLRGLGSTSTLTLIDGSRVALGGGSGTFVDLTLIPALLIERIEVLADGASALYGSDAVAGVVNVKLRRSFEGAETMVRFGIGQGFEEMQAGQLAGTDWKSGRLAVAYEYYDRGRVPAADRDYVTEDLRAFGGPDYRRPFANPGTIIAADGSVFAIPAGQDGRSLEPADLVAGQANLRDGRLGTDVVPAVSRHGAAASIEQDLGEQFTARLSGFFANRTSVQRTFPSNYGNVIVPTTNPFYVDPVGTNEPILVNYAFTDDLGPQTLNAHVTAWSGIAALERRFGSWTGTLSGTYGLQTERQRTVNVPNYFYLAEALADPDPATAYNVLGDGSNTPSATIDSIRGFYEQTGRSRIWSAGAKAEGPLFELPAGALRMAVGAEYRREHYAFSDRDFEFTPEPVDLGTAGFPIGRSIMAGYGELLIPVVRRDQQVTGIDELTLSVAGRIEHYSDFGTTANPKFGATWRPVEDLSLRGTYGTSFRAPSFVDIRTGRGTSLVIPVPLPDPASPTGSTIGLALFGASPGVGPERAETFSLGFDFQPRTVAGLRLSATYFDVAYRDRIASLGVDYLSFLAGRDRYGGLITDAPDPALVAGFYGDVNFANPFGIPADAIAVIVDGRTKNLSRLNQRGIDFDASYRFDLDAVSIEAGVSGAYLIAIEQKVTDNAPSADVVSTIGNPVDLRVRTRAIVTAGSLGLAAFVNHSNGYRNTAVTPSEPVSGFTTLDAQLSYSFGERSDALSGLRAALSISNLFDRDPPFVNNATVFSASGFDPEQASALGRIVALQLTKSW